MLKIIDLNQNEELSSFEMGKVAGGQEDDFNTDPANQMCKCVPDAPTWQEAGEAAIATWNSIFGNLK